ncbi:MAG TPA: carboxymuconolactone decarboxylase family protein, partial [Thermoanaerobaculaceae bacterium]|nr:carboxymuconolactone decarboxylase family protein [Thermoanaerobaculaceae bacterium]
TTAPTPEQVLAMMRQKMGETLPAWPEILQNLAPDLLIGTAMNSAGSVGREASSIPAKYRSLIAVAAALGRGQANCARSQAYMARQAGATAEEVLDAVRIARHLAAAGILDAASPLLADLGGKPIPSEPAR